MNAIEHNSPSANTFLNHNKKPIPFVKMHGLGNNFVMINGTEIENIQGHKKNELVALAGNSSTGIGCDQIIIYNIRDNLKVEMVIYNNDSSSAKACGNGARCLALLMKDLFHMNNFDIIASDRTLPAKSLGQKDVQINMGKANFAAGWMPTDSRMWQLAEQLGLEPKEAICVDIGNPHLVIFSMVQQQEKDVIGKKLQDHELFPGGINVNFASMHDNQLDLSVYERGAGFTLACGSGACASFAAASKLGFCADNLQINYPLGSLKMSSIGADIIMQGPAEYVFSGELYL